MCWLKFDQLDDIGLFVRWTWVLATLLHLLATEILECNLQEVYGILVLELIEEETDQVL